MTSINNAAPVSNAAYEATPAAEQPPSVIALLNSQDQLALLFGGDGNARLAAMVLKHSSERREGLDQAREKQEERVVKMEAEEVSKMREEAKHVRDQARIEGTSQIVGGSLQVGSAFFSSPKAGSKDIDYSKLLGGGATAAPGVGKLVGAESGYQAMYASADGVAAQNRADEGLRRIDELRDEMDDIKDLENAGKEFIKTIQNIEAQTNNALIFQRV